MGQTSCKIEGCKRRYRAKGYCNIHYRDWRHGKLKKGRYKTCTAENCRKPRVSGSRCGEHSGKKIEAAPVAAPAPEKKQEEVPK